METILSRRAFGWQPVRTESGDDSTAATPIPATLRVECAWCGKVLANPEGTVISHGICPECSKKWRAEAAAGIEPR